MYRILTIDGGGMKGVFPAALLADLEGKVGGRIVDYFDLIVGTSTGGLIALALGMGKSASEILSFYEEDGPKIFACGELRKWLSLIWRPSWHDNKPLKEAVSNMFGELLLGESRCRLVIPTFLKNNGKAYLYKTSHHPKYITDYSTLTADIALATSAAPLYFQTHLTRLEQMFLDGAMWANNPMAVAAIEAHCILNWSQSDVFMLSLGCTEEPFQVEEKGLTSPFRFISTIRNISNCFLSAQSTSAEGMARLLLGTDKVYRINPVVRPGSHKLDSAQNIEQLRVLGIEEARTNFTALQSIFFKTKAEPFQPLHPGESK